MTTSLCKGDGNCLDHNIERKNGLRSLSRLITRQMCSENRGKNGSYDPLQGHLEVCHRGLSKLENGGKYSKFNVNLPFFESIKIWYLNVLFSTVVPVDDPTNTSSSLFSSCSRISSNMMLAQLFCQQLIPMLANICYLRHQSRVHKPKHPLHEMSNILWFELYSFCN